MIIDPLSQTADPLLGLSKTAEVDDEENEELPVEENRQLHLKFEGLCDICHNKLEAETPSTDSISMCVSCRETQCQNCGKYAGYTLITAPDKKKICSVCMSELWGVCPNCDAAINSQDDFLIVNADRRARYGRIEVGLLNGTIGCDKCLANCASCNGVTLDLEHMKESPMVDNEYYCERCYDNLFSLCDECGHEAYQEDCRFIDEHVLCADCFDKDYSTCYTCGGNFNKQKLATNGYGQSVCEDCDPDAFATGELPKEYQDKIKVESVHFNKLNRALGELKKLLPISPKELNKKHPRLAQLCKTIISFSKGKELTLELVNKFEESLPKEEYPVAYSVWRSDLQRSVSSRAPQLVINILASEKLLATMHEYNTDKLLEAINQNSRDSGHPYVENQLGWARVELFKHEGITESYILIDEIQSDHFNALDRINYSYGPNGVYNRYGAYSEVKRSLGLGEEDWAEYCKDFKEQIKNFSDIAIEAVSSFAKANGYKHIYYHTYESGKELKRNNPPKSMYTDLPERHFFAPTEKTPFNLRGKFLSRDASNKNIIMKNTRIKTFRKMAVDDVTNLDESAACPVCGEVEVLTEVEDGLPLCEKCANNKCDNCFEYKQSISESPSLDKLCEDCMDQLYPVCQNCDERVPHDDILTPNRTPFRNIIRSVPNRAGCIKCSSKCESCYRVFDKGDTNEGGDGELYCDSCYGEIWFQCDECNEVYHRDESNYVSDDSVDLCNSCFNDTYGKCYACDSIKNKNYLRENEDGDSYCEDCGPWLFHDIANIMAADDITKIEHVSFNQFNRVLNRLRPLLPISPKDLNKNHPRLAQLCKAVISFSGGKEITPELVDRFESERLSKETYPISFSLWNSQLQRSVKSKKPQLVINVVASDELLGKMKADNTYYLFDKINDTSKESGHPYVKDQLCWIRVDLNQEEKYILVDEIQSDHMNALDRINNEEYMGKKYGEYIADQLKLTPEQWKKYCAQYKKHIKDFADIAVDAVNNFAKINGCEKIFYHTYESGKELKHNAPPESLYTQLPTRHFFEPTEEVPFGLQGKFLSRQSGAILELCHRFLKLAKLL